MNPVKKSSLATLLALVGLLAVFACETDSLDDAYRRIYLAKYAVDFPTSEEELHRCESNRVKTCLDLVAKATDGKRRLLAVEPNKALDRTLKTIVSSCPLEDSDQQELCLGAIVALYFFTEPELDARILRELMKAERTVLHKVFSPSMFGWYYNRPQPKVWIDAVSKLPPDDFPHDGKASVINAFGASKPAGLGDGVRLLK
ncbi:hypothetical protein QZJ86_20190 [Methylomonas montana]|uniref:hypothetical protein n=1 Tax=Methylomonas montana TaxID=3058963 RepID=UPI00265956CE|nr:hypothetical protein [Methylomonas montana]WKJ90302.1 hypothetical protein QZJ86_20190 [Methylomonas montana]